MTVMIENRPRVSKITPRDLAAFKELLNDELETLLCQAGAAVSEMARGQHREIEIVDTAMGVINQNLTLRLQTRKSFLIKKIRSALLRIEEGTYGDCEICGEPISLKRLAARPVTSKCLSCKEAEERMEKLMA